MCPPRGTLQVSGGSKYVHQRAVLTDLALPEDASLSGSLTAIPSLELRLGTRDPGQTRTDEEGCLSLPVDGLWHGAGGPGLLSHKT